MSGKKMSVLLAEDDEGHAFLVQKNLQRLGVTNSIVHVSDGQSALDYVRREGEFSGRPARGPLLVVLDINMPRLDGIEVLTVLKASNSTSAIPVVMLTTTDDPREIERCYQLGCSAYVTKPIEYENFVETICRIGRFLEIIQVPGENRIHAA